MNKSLVIVFIFFVLGCVAMRAGGVFDNLDRSSDMEYVVRLTNGELLIGSIADVLDSTAQGRAIKLKTAIGTATIYESQVLEIRPVDSYYREAHRVFVMPTAEPISGNHYIGNVELFSLFAGIGIYDVGSIMLARTVIPSIGSRDQISIVNLKATIFEEQYTTMPGKFNLALGTNFAWLNTANRITDVYMAATFTRVRSRLTGIVFANVSGYHSDIFTVNAGTYGSLLMHYPSGAIGVGIGLDTRIPGRQDLHFIGELWNGNLEAASNSILVLGLRLANSSVSFDFGMAVVTTPGFFPVTSFSWTPL